LRHAGRFNATVVTAPLDPTITQASDMGGS
jgi:hypothetical protein